MNYTGLMLSGMAIAFSVGCSGGSPTTSQASSGSPTTAPAVETTTVTPTGAQLNDEFVARVSAVPDLRTEMADGGFASSDDLATLGREVCRATLSKPVDGGPAMAVTRAGIYLELKMKSPLVDPSREQPRSLSEPVRAAFVRAAAQAFCPDNPAGVR